MWLVSPCAQVDECKQRMTAGFLFKNWYIVLDNEVLEIVAIKEKAAVFAEERSRVKCIEEYKTHKKAALATFLSSRTEEEVKKMNNDELKDVVRFNKKRETMWCQQRRQILSIDIMQLFHGRNLHIIFDVKMGDNLYGKYRMVVGYHKITTPYPLTYFPVVFRYSVRIALTIYVLNYLKVLACNIQNGYLTANFQ